MAKYLRRTDVIAFEIARVDNLLITDSEGTVREFNPAWIQEYRPVAGDFLKFEGRGYVSVNRHDFLASHEAEDGGDAVKVEGVDDLPPAPEQPTEQQAPVGPSGE